MGPGLFVASSTLKQADLMSAGSLRFVSGLQAHHRILPPSQSGAIYIFTMLVYPLVLMHSRTHTEYYLLSRMKFDWPMKLLFGMTMLQDAWVLGTDQ
ncbi:hypothetical protein F4811DRAFT_553002 [Daldinia bambusicola]|nr:hypothetical protein F4811DRAFT_553002 [Daldinia bambusicola]